MFIFGTPVPPFDMWSLQYAPTESLQSEHVYEMETSCSVAVSRLAIVCR
jgi:hypothetical protein